MPEPDTPSDDSDGEPSADYVCPLCDHGDDAELQMDKHLLSAHSLNDRVGHLLAVAGGEGSSA